MSEATESPRHMENTQPVASEGGAGSGPGVALCLSGGGFRATLFHLGALRRLNEFGLLSRFDAISSVSGGSILNGVLATRWPRLAIDIAGSGTAIALGQYMLAEDELRAAQLLTPFPTSIPLQYNYCAVHSPDNSRNQTVQKFVTWLRTLPGGQQ